MNRFSRQWLLVLVMTFTSGQSLAQSRIGNIIRADQAHDNFGKSISLSADGNRVAIGAHHHDGIPGNSTHGVGSVQIMEFDGTRWQQMGQRIYGVSSPEQLGFSVALSGNGLRVAVGSIQAWGNDQSSGKVRVYAFDDSLWVPLGNEIDGESKDDASGYATSFNSDGEILAIGAPNNSGGGQRHGHVRVFKLENEEWVQLGSDIDADSTSRIGFHVALSEDGKTLGADNKLFEFTDGEWNQIGEDLPGGQIQLAQNGQRFAITSLRGDSTTSFRYHLRVFDRVGENLTQIGRDLLSYPGSVPWQARMSFAISDDGNRLALGHPIDNGIVRMYEYNGHFWRQSGSDIPSSPAGYEIRDILDLSSDGSRLATTAWQNYTWGNVQIYEDFTPVSNESDLPNSNSTLVIYPNPINSSEAIFLESEHLIESVEFFDLMGRSVDQWNGDFSERFSIDKLSLAKGVYFVRVKTLEGLLESKLVVR